MRSRPAPSTLAAVIALAIVGISVSGPLARLSAAPPLAIAVWRLTLSMAILAVPLLWTGSWREWRTLSRRDLLIAVGAGALLALHFWSWVASLGMTSVAASVLLVNLHPTVIVSGSALWLGERPARQQLAGLAVATLGAVWIAFAPSASDVAAGTSSGRASVGNALALVGAVTVGLYYLAGRSLRQRLSLWPYVGLVYAACLGVLVLLAITTGTPLWPYPPREVALFSLIALGPMLAGHTGFNWALRYVPAVVVSLALLAEPVGAAALAWLLFGETLSPVMLGGGVMILAGLAVAATSRG